jgi:glutamine amidotransferase
MGEVAERKNAPFRFGHWLGAHNGTLNGFPSQGDVWRRSIPTHLRRGIKGTTDSEVFFFLILAELEKRAGIITGNIEPQKAAGAVATVIAKLQRWQASSRKKSEYNVILTDGRILLAARHGFTLYWLKRDAFCHGDPDLPARPYSDYRAVAVASEPTTTEAWQAIPTRHIFWLDSHFEHGTIAI